MMFYHHDLEVELPDVWWSEAGMECFTPFSRGLPEHARN
jgi:hypothetical protein